MAKKNEQNEEFRAFKAALKNRQPERFYILHGVERYLLEYYLQKLRSLLLPEGLEEFNYKRFDGSKLSVSSLSAAVDSLPVFSDRTLIEIHDYDVFQRSEAERTEILETVSDLPEYVCLVFVYDTVEYKADKRQKLNSAILKEAHVVEFQEQDQSDLINWLTRRFAALKKNISRQDAEYLLFLSDGLMTTLASEVEKLAAHSKKATVTRADIDAVVEPLPDAVIYKFTDAVARSDFSAASETLGQLFLMREVPQKIIYGISLKMRQLLAARLCLDSGRSSSDLIEMTNLRFSFQARILLDSARSISTERCAKAVELCANTAARMNSGGDAEAHLTDLLVRLAGM